MLRSTLFLKNIDNEIKLLQDQRNKLSSQYQQNSGGFVKLQKLPNKAT